MKRAFERAVGTARVVAGRNATGAIPIAYNLIQLVLPREMFSHNLYSGNMFLMMKLMMPFPVIIGGLAVRRFFCKLKFITKMACSDWCAECDSVHRSD